MMNVATASVRPVRLVLWYAAIVVAYGALMLAYAGIPVDGRHTWFFTLYIAGSSALAVWGASVLPELVANSRSRLGHRTLYVLAAFATAVALAVSGYFANRFGFHPVSLIFAACVIFLASVPFFAALVFTIVAEWYMRLPKRRP